MVVGVHAVVGAAVGSLTRNRVGAAALGVLAHAACDVIPHRDLSAPVEVAAAAAALGAIGLAAGWRSSPFWGAVGGVLPDLENLVPSAYRGGHKWFPSHWFAHTVGRQPIWPTVLVAGAAIGWLLYVRGRARRDSPPQLPGGPSAGGGTSARSASRRTPHQP